MTPHGFISTSLTFDLHLAFIFSPALFHSSRQTVNNSSPVAVYFHNGPVFLSPRPLALPESWRRSFFSVLILPLMFPFRRCVLASYLSTSSLSPSVRSSRPAEEHSHREAAQHGGPSHCPPSTLPTIRE